MVTFDYLTKIYYKDIDQMGVVYYARYFEFFEQARTELLCDIGLIVTKIENDGYFIPVVSATCIYKEGAKFEDEIIVRTMIKEVPHARMKIEYEVYNPVCPKFNIIQRDKNYGVCTLGQMHHIMEEGWTGWWSPYFLKR